MLKLKQLGLTEKGHVEAVYTVRHSAGAFDTTLEQDLHLSMNPHTRRITGRLELTELEADSLDAAREKMAEWCERMAAALRRPLQAVAAFPVFETLPFEPHQLSAGNRAIYDALVQELVTIGTTRQLPGKLDDQEEDLRDAVWDHIRAITTREHPLALINGALEHAGTHAWRQIEALLPDTRA